MDNIQTAERIKKRCSDMEISIAALLRECNIDKGFIYDLTGRSKSTAVDKIEKIAIRLDCSVDYLIGRTDNPEVNKY